MEKLPAFHIRILQLLARSWGAGCTLEELGGLMIPVSNAGALTAGDMRSENRIQAAVLDALLILNDRGHIFLNPHTDKSTITIKGLTAIRSTMLCN